MLCMYLMRILDVYILENREDWKTFLTLAIAYRESISDCIVMKGPIYISNKLYKQFV